MKILKKISDDEVIAHFLKTEIASERFKKFKKKILSTSKKLKQSRKIIDSPNLENAGENQIRKAILTEFRTSTLYNFPTDLEWYRALLTKEELKKVKYIDYSYWNELSNGTNLVKEGADSVRKGIEVFGESNEGFLKAADHIKAGGTFPEVILVAKDRDSDLIILEGHLRLTAYLLAYDYIPAEIEVIVGFSPNITKWT